MADPSDHLISKRIINYELRADQLLYAYEYEHKEEEYGRGVQGRIRKRKAHVGRGGGRLVRHGHRVERDQPEHEVVERARARQVHAPPPQTAQHTPMQYYIRVRILTD